MSRRNQPHRSIGMSPLRRRQLAIISEYLGMSGESFIQMCVFRGITDVATRDSALGMMLARAAISDDGE